jgi:hypothetical protein
MRSAHALIPLAVAVAVAVLSGCSCNDRIQSRSPAYDLGIVRTGAGKITSDPGGINCGDTCAARFPTGTVIKLFAAPEHPDGFVGWSGACQGKDVCVLTSDANRTVTATFLNGLYVAKEGNGQVRVEPTGQSCGGGTSNCVGLFDHDTPITLSATAELGYRFDGWTGACTGLGACNLRMDGTKSVGARFLQEGGTSHQLVVNLAGGGGGTVTSSPPGIDCGLICNLPVPQGTQVTLTATPQGSSEFVGWTGACSGANPTCVVTMDASKSVTARFEMPAPCLWARRIGGAGFDNARSLAINASGHLLMSADVQNRTDFGLGPLSAPDGRTISSCSPGASGCSPSNMAVATFNPDGSTRTAWGQGKPTAPLAVMYTTDAQWLPNGDVAVSGAYSGTVDLGDGAQSDGTTNSWGVGYVAAYSVNGAARWIRRLGGLWPMTPGFGALSVDSNGETSVTSYFDEPANFGGSTVHTPDQSVCPSLPTVACSDAFVARYDTSGTLRWVKSFGGDYSEAGQGIVVTPDRVYAVGSFQGSIDFGGGARSGLDDLYIVAYDAAGAYQWDLLGKDDGYSTAWAAAPFPNGDIAVVGEFGGTLNLGNKSVTSSGSNGDGFAARITPTGQVSWLVRFGGQNWDAAYVVAVDEGGNLAVGGNWSGSANFGQGTVNSRNGSTDVFVVKLDGNGNTLFSAVYGGDSTDWIEGLVLDRRGNIIVAGAFEGTIHFGSWASRQSAGYTDIYLACIGPNP